MFLHALLLRHGQDINSKEIHLISKYAIKYNDALFPESVNDVQSKTVKMKAHLNETFCNAKFKV